VLFYIILFGAWLRFWGIFNEFWLDEIRSFFLVSTLHSPIQTLTNLFYDNLPLNSLFMYLIGWHNPTYWFKFHLLSLTMGTLTIPLLLKFYSAFVPNAGIYYVPLERITINPPEWFILQVQEKNFYSYPLIIINQGPMYVFEKAYLYCGDFSGVNWQLYHLAAKNLQSQRAHAELIGITKPNQY